MKIVDRKTFLACPKNTLYSKYEPFVFGQLEIKGANCGADDFWTQAIADGVFYDGTEDLIETLADAAVTGDSIPMDLDCESRDGCFDSDQLFAIWEPDDVASLIARLSEVA